MSRTLPFRGGELVVTYHALRRLQERWESESGQLSAEAALGLLERLLADARPAQMGTAKRVNRIINNRFRPAEYWASSGMRFVIVRENEVQTLVTIERNLP